MKRTEFERVFPEEAGIPSSLIDWLLDQLESGFTEPHGLMIMRHGKICAEGWWTPFSPGMRHGQQSHSKTYAATAVGIAYTEGLLRLDDRLIDIFPEESPENPSENLKKLTVHHVLCMSCGMDEMPAPSFNWITDFLSTEIKHEPGTAYMYNSVGSTILGAIVRKKTGLGLQEYLKPRLFDKIGIDCGHMYWACMPDGMEVGGGGLYATTEDNLRLMKLYADGGVWNGEQILAKDYVEKATGFQMATETEREGNPEADDNFLGYGYQIWMCTPPRVYRADGAMGQFTIVDPDHDLILAITENAGGAHWAQKTLDTIWEFLKKIPEDESSVFDTSAPSPQALSLKKRLAALSLPAPRFQPYSPVSQSVNGNVYEFKDDNLHFEYYGMTQTMAGIPPRVPVKKLRLSLSDTICTLNYTNTEGIQETIAADMTGSCYTNIVGNTVPSRALVSACWSEENTLKITFRWIETCDVITYSFVFQADGVTVTYTSHDDFLFREVVCNAVLTGKDLRQLA